MGWLLEGCLLPRSAPNQPAPRDGHRGQRREQVGRSHECRGDKPLGIKISWEGRGANPLRGAESKSPSSVGAPCAHSPDTPARTRNVQFHDTPWPPKVLLFKPHPPGTPQTGRYGVHSLLLFTIFCNQRKSIYLKQLP